MLSAYSLECTDSHGLDKCFDKTSLRNPAQFSVPTTKQIAHTKSSVELETCIFKNKRWIPGFKSWLVRLNVCKNDKMLSAKKVVYVVFPKLLS